MNNSKRKARYLIALAVLTTLQFGLFSMGVTFIPRTVIGIAFLVWISPWMEGAR